MSQLKGRTAGMVLLLAASSIAAQLPPSSGTPVTLQPGDVVRVEIWREADLSGEFAVNEAGSVTLPLLGDRPVVGIALPELKDSLLRDYREQLRNPSITITPLRRIYVLGEVNQPALYQVDPTISLAGAIALAGGATTEGDITRVRVIRGSEVIVDRVPAEKALVAIDIRSGDQIFVGRRGWFERNTTFLVSAMLSIASIVVSLSR